MVTAFAGECLEFLINMILARELGEAGLGTYMSILPTVFLIVILSSMELPISLSKFSQRKKSIFTGDASLCLPLCRGHDMQPFTSYGAALYVDAIISRVPSRDTMARPDRDSDCVFTSITRGYFMGIHQMGKIAAANFLRKGIQLAL